MPADKFRFISPGVFLTEVDQSQIPNNDLGQRGPLVIGRAKKGPAFQPSRVTSFDEFTQLFGTPVPGAGAGKDAWRNPARSTPMYGTYAAEAYLANNQPVTYMRLLGAQHPSVTGDTAGSNGWKVPAMNTSSGGGAYGLFIFPSASGDDITVTGTLAAIWYANEGVKITLSGDPADGVTASTGSVDLNAALLKGIGTGKDFIVKIDNAGTVETKAFNFTRNDVNYIRNVFNTDPTRLNTNLYPSNSPMLKKYVLGQTFETAVSKLSSDVGYLGMMLELATADGTTASGGNFAGLVDNDGGPKTAKTGWFFSQDIGESGSFNPLTSTTNLFKIHALQGTGEQTQAEIKISIRDLRFPSAVEQASNPYPTFTLEVRKLSDTDRSKVVYETFTGLNLNPASTKYIGAVIGDKYTEYNAVTLRTEERGDYDNKSKFIRVEVSPEVSDGTALPSLMPFGVVGPPKFNTFEIVRNPVGTLEQAEMITGSIVGSNVFVKPNNMPNQTNNAAYTSSDTTVVMNLGIDLTSSIATMSCEFPSIPLIASASDSTTANSQTNAYFGTDLQSSVGGKLTATDIVDLNRILPTGLDESSAYTDYQYVFTLDNVRNSSGDGTGNWSYASGSRNLGPLTTRRWTAASGAANLVNVQGINKFTTVLYGGFDGLDIRELNPFRNTLLGGGTNVDSAKYTGAGETQNYAVHSIQRALNTVKDPEYVDFNLAAMPGITNEALTDELVDLCEERADALAVIDIQDDYQPRHEGSSNSYPEMPDVDAALTTWRTRDLNSSYGAAFFPWVQSRDARSGQLIWLPPSVPALGTIGSSAARSELWFAPAGFNRGGLTNGAAGLSIVNVRKKLTSKDRDRLYDSRINPIASFPSEGIVIFGQKTLQVEASALDRINVRRLLIHLKKKISIIANNILFDQNIPATWARFRGQVDPFLNDVKTRFGLTDYKVVLDEKTTTPDLIDRNILYAKIYLKPARAIEFIALDFFITSTGASFED
jgi:phage tail sheath protein FI